MPTRGGNGGPIAVGAVLKQTRERRRIDLETVQAETKIRSKYLRALEDEDWDVLPGPAYARGFIRAYADLLGLDSEVLVDEFRRRHEQPPTESYERPAPLVGGRGPRERVVSPTAHYAVLGAVAVAVAVAVVLLVLGVIAGSDDGGGGGGGSAASGREGKDRKAANRGSGSQGSKPGDVPGEVTVKLVARSDVQACLIDNRDRVLIPDQLLTTGVEDGPYVAKEFRLELDPGEAEVVVNGERAAVPRTSEPAAYKLAPRGVRATEFTGRLCE